MEELPTQTCDRVPNTFYIYKQQTRFWNGKKLLCKHKKSTSICPTCNPEGAERERQRKREWQQNHRCEHEKQRSRCPTCTQEGAERYRERAREQYQNNTEVRQRNRKNNLNWRLFMTRILFSL